LSSFFTLVGSSFSFFSGEGSFSPFFFSSAGLDSSLSDGLRFRFLGSSFFIVLNIASMKPVLEIIAGDLLPDLGLSLSGDLLFFASGIAREGRRLSPFTEFFMGTGDSFLLLVGGCE
jgi:hypothetical protein